MLLVLSLRYTYALFVLLNLEAVRILKKTSGLNLCFNLYRAFRNAIIISFEGF